MSKYIIAGGGLAGLAAAYAMQNTKNNISLLEAENRVGGRILTIPHHGRFMDLGAQFYCRGNHNFWNLATAVGCSPPKIIKGLVPNIYHQDRRLLLTLKNILLNTSLKEKIELSKLRYKLNRFDYNSDFNIDNDTTFSEWYYKHIGNEMLWLCDALLRGICFSYSNKISAGYALRILKAILADNLYTFNEGMGEINTKLENFLNRRKNVHLILKADIKKINIENDAVSDCTYEFQNNLVNVNTNKLISTVPAPILYKVLNQKIKPLNEIEYSPVVYLLLLFNKHMRGDLDIFFSDPKFPISGTANEMYKFQGGMGALGVIFPDCGKIIKKTNDQITNLAINLLSDKLPINEKHITGSIVLRWHYGMPVPSPQFFINQNAIKNHGIDGLYICGDFMNMPCLEGAIVSVYDSLNLK
ncbi:MAG: Flavin containing amine oxidoreductase [Candidatus Fermentimicrarchaeum limneticum]|uniref:Flavin containing amine oxidoreductase n=1 Tax=Fermentimicrarchaeum limneticum TaxID=2795018 RepID=A0A7D5XDE6_FERL1|nr:MAG: Flavin containing amine oxidoreductase [Candidatus Fermentimicrarchaeum limneticum]